MPLNHTPRPRHAPAVGPPAPSPAGHLLLVLLALAFGMALMVLAATDERPTGPVEPTICEEPPCRRL